MVSSLRSGTAPAALGALALAWFAAAALGQGGDPLALRRTLSVSAPATPSSTTDEREPGTLPDEVTTEETEPRTPPRRAQKNKRTVATVPAAPAPMTIVPGTVRERAEITGAIPTVRRRVRKLEEEEPYAPAGISVGSYTLRSILDLGVGYDNNALRVPGGPGSKFYVIAPQFSLRSNWSRHELTADLRGSYTGYWDVSGNNRPELYGTVRGRIDVSALTRLELEARGAVTTEAPGSPDAIAAAVRPPNVYTYGGTLGWLQRFNRFEFALRGLVDRYSYQSAKLTSGAVLDLSDRDFVAPGIKLRGSYEVLAGLSPFAEIGADRRIFDHAYDFSGIRRESDGWFARAGFAFERKGFLTGEISAGYMQRLYRDPLLPDISGPTLDASLIWTISPLARLTLAATSSIDETRVPFASGLFRHQASATVEHAFRRWLIGSASLTYAIEDYRGAGLIDQRLRASAGFLYYLNRTVALRGELRHERLISDLPGQDWNANVALFGVRLQR